ncbi:type III-B CRISPR-associated protein Cas10/Cmr2 [Thermoflavimicrobium dichotomicum]|uniref:CRISPR-associated protein Cmr2 n=1 Tax=Thermoflavimicrobium dichotomicum TaxID=46223 RepID=A0A1I3URM1_9BACL|nr:type III-B CRISPR-associated protein Cas10/Cmr2 [Thermoflavimicrobium dichotomicum]SFJ85610.1 CRISPR-associated protein Cmr2 [Thermoflavimicrobium dichotomicum]
MSERILHFTIGPVQSFIAQSRRTRDLLASSFLLSYLSGVAMHRVIQAGGTLLFPSFEIHQNGIQDDLLAAIQQAEKQAFSDWTGPWIGTLPNRFKARIPYDFHPSACVEAVQNAWQRIAKAVQTHITRELKQAEIGDTLWNRAETQMIWERQISHLWEITWAIGEEHDLLDRRKNWRTHLMPMEIGEKCSIISHYQELSGSPGKSEEQQAFWRAIHECMSEIDPDEKLSAIAMIKRLFPHVTKQAIGWRIPPAAIHIPSTLYLAALPWREKAWQQCPELVQAYGKKAGQYGLEQQDVKVHFPQLFDSLTEDSILFFKLPGEFTLSHTVENTISKHPRLSDRQKKELCHLYQQMIEKVGEPEPYYALLILDGDQLGALLRQIDAGKISRAITHFSRQMNEAVRKFKGVPIYAGGDDVMAMFPMTTALDAARHLRERYITSFAEIRREGVPATCSVAIVYAHCSTHLQEVLQYGRELLEQHAKEQSGRDSLAMGIWKRTGSEVIWTAPWEGANGQPSAVDVLTQLIQGDTKPEGTEELAITEILTNTYLKKIQTHFAHLPHFPYSSLDQGTDTPLNHKKLLETLITSDLYRLFQKQIDQNPAKKRNIQQAVRALLQVSFRSWREDGAIHLAEGEFQSSAAQFIHFLRQKGENDS